VSCPPPEQRPGSASPSDQAAVLASLSDDVSIRIAVHDEPLRGNDTASFLFGVLTQELAAPFELTEEIVEGNKSVILFETSLQGGPGKKSGKARKPL
jgi:hypothetical protein